MSLADAVQEHVDRIREARLSQPPTMVAGPVDAPIPFGPEEEETVRGQLMDRAAKSLGIIGKTAATPFTLTAEGLARADDAFRVSILTAMGRVPAKDYGKYFQEAISGKRRISGDEFNRLAFGQVAWEQMRNSKVRLPEWVKMWMVPDRYVTENKDGSKDLALGSAFLGASAEMFVSPFAVGSLLPRTALQASRAGSLLVKAVDAPSNALLAPLRLARWGALHPRTPFSLYLLQMLGPETAVGKKLPDFVRRIVENDADFAHNVRKAHDAVKEAIDPHKGLLLDSAVQNRVLRHLFEAPQKLQAGEQQLVDDLWTKFGEPLRLRAAAMKYTKGPSGEWASDQYFRQFMPSARNARLGQIRPIGEQGMPHLVEINVPWKNAKAKLPADWTDFTDVASSLENFIAAWEKKLTWDARHFELRPTSKAFQRRELKKAQEAGLATVPPLMREVEVKDGAWAIYSPKIGYLSSRKVEYTDALGNRRVRIEKENPLLKDLDFREYQYMKKFGTVLAGNRASHNEIGFNNITEQFVASLDANVRSAARKSRILAVLYDKGVIDPTSLPTRVDAAAAGMVASTMISTLGLNLASSLHNLGQILNTAAVHGISPVMRGIFNMASPGDAGKLLRGARKEARFNAAFQQLVFDEETRFRLGRGLLDFFMKPFNATEMFVRGVAYNVGLEKALRSRGLSLDDAVRQGQKLPGLLEAMKEAKRASLDTNFVYGLAGRGPLMAGPVARVAFALQSFSIKEAEFLARTWDRDGGAVMKWINLNGWAIDMLDKGAGVNAESWLGWGFVPPNTFGRGPQVETALNLVRMLNARAEGNVQEYEKAASATRGSLHEVFRAFGVEGGESEGTQTFIQSIAMLGVLPVPVIGIARTAKAYNEFMTGQRYERGGQYFRPVTKEEALQSWFVTTHRTYADQQLAAMERSVRAQVDQELDRRSKKFVRALRGKSGDEVMAAADELATAVPLKVPFAHSRSLGMPSLLFRLGDETSFWAPAEMTQSRIRNLLRGATVSRAIIEMEEAGWTSQILWAAYQNAAFREIEQGGIIPLAQGGGR